jgi:dTDP-4-amino-4,6-dideoxygalactose transaminase
MNIAMVDLKRQYATIKDEIDSAIKEVIESTHFIMGEQVSEFESKAAAYIGAKYAASCASGTEALQIAMMSLGIGSGDEVITSPFTFVATCETVAIIGAKPVYVDIDEKTFNIDVTKIEAAITPKTKAIIPVHLYGQSSDMDAIMAIAKKHNLYVIEDAAQAFGCQYKGTKVGSIGTIGCTSFFPSKNLGGYGDSGMCFTNDESVFKKMKIIANHGSQIRYHHEMLGLNSRMDTLQAAILLKKLKYIDKWNAQRAANADLYSRNLAGSSVVTPYTAEFSNHIFHQYTIKIKNRAGLEEVLKVNKIPYGVYYPIPLHKQQAFLEFGKGLTLPVAESLCDEVLSLPMHPDLKKEEIDFISDTILGFVKK